MTEEAQKIARLNIEHYRRLLAEEQALKDRERIFRLLAQEEAKLAVLQEQKPSHKNGKNS